MTAFWRRRAPAGLVLAGALFSVVATSAAESRTWCQLPEEIILRNFGAIAFGSEHQRILRPRVMKWVTPIRYRPESRVDVLPAVLDDLHNHMRALARITGHPIRPARRGERANFRILFTRLSAFRSDIASNLRPPNPQLVRRLRQADCIGILRARGRDNAIVSAIAIIPVDHARSRGLLFHCIVEETTQLMGLPNDSDAADFSIFNDRSRQDDLGCQDKIFLRLLYHPDLRVGTYQPQALRVARRLLRRLK